MQNVCLIVCEVAGMPQLDGHQSNWYNVSMVLKIIMMDWGVILKILSRAITIYEANSP